MDENEIRRVGTARDGDRQAWDALFRRFQRPLFTYFMEMVRNEQLALDLVQETFMSAIRYIGSLHSDERFASWLFGIGRQKCLQHWRRSSRHPEVALSEVFPDTEFDRERPDETMIRIEDEERLWRAVKELPELHREVLVLFYVEDFSVEEIAGITGTHAGTIKSRLHNARKKLQKLIPGVS